MAYQTTNILNFELDFPTPRLAKQRNHQAEKPLTLYECLISNLTQENDTCLDQFGGACNMLAAAVNLNRFSIVYELEKDTVQKAVSRLGCCTVRTSGQDNPESTNDDME